MTYARPEAAVSMPRVATNGATLRRLMMRPLMRPARRPTPTAPATASQRRSGCPTTIEAPVMALTAMTLPTDRSMPPVRITSVWPSATSANGAAAIRIVRRFGRVANRALS
jgi:hypothetical protein